ncbi:lipopolysaccharide biosynthesis protein, partial [Clostridium perfringens]|uniref:lipopolysaccharide biosynthesis protein n=1 Tax=Clostridium perfringens TaxID=1502 RepID=UPI001E62527A
LTILLAIILIITKNYEMFLIIKIVVTITENILVAKKVDKMYTFLLNKDNVKLGKKEKNSIIKNVKALLYHKIGGVIVNSTDNILISKFVGITSVGLYSNYYLIIGALNLLIGQSFSALTASVGNLNAVESKEKSYNTYKLILFINFWIAGFSSICLWILFEPFITLWIGKQYLFKNYIVLIIVINFYILTIRRTTLLYKDSCGLFWNDRYKPIIESVVNIIVSIVLAPKLGISGVFIGTFISTLSSAFWMEPYVLYKYGFNRKVREYFKMFIVYTIIIILVGFSTTIICNTMTGTEIIVFIKKICVCILVPNGLLSICFHKKDEFKQVINLIKYILNNILKYRIKSWLNI